MLNDQATVRRAVSERAAASIRVRRATGVILAGAAALTGVFTALAAGSTHARKVVSRVHHQRVVAHPNRPVTAPDPPLVRLHGISSAPPSTSVAPPVATPSTPPVAVSGGS